MAYGSWTGMARGAPDEWHTLELGNLLRIDLRGDILRNRQRWRVHTSTFSLDSFENLDAAFEAVNKRLLDGEQLFVEHLRKLRAASNVEVANVQRR